MRSHACGAGCVANWLLWSVRHEYIVNSSLCIEMVLSNPGSKMIYHKGKQNCIVHVLDRGKGSWKKAKHSTAEDYLQCRPSSWTTLNTHSTSGLMRSGQMLLSNQVAVPDRHSVLPSQHRSLLVAAMLNSRRDAVRLSLETYRHRGPQWPASQSQKRHDGSLCCER